MRVMLRGYVILIYGILSGRPRYYPYHRPQSSALAVGSKTSTVTNHSQFPWAPPPDPWAPPPPPWWAPPPDPWAPPPPPWAAPPPPPWAAPPPPCPPPPCPTTPAPKKKD